MEQPTNPDAATPALFVSVTAGDGGGLVIELDGDLDLSTIGQLERLIPAMAEVDGHGVCLDLRGLRFLDSSGLRVLLAISQSLAPSRRLVLRHPGSVVQKVLDVSGTRQLFDIEM